MNLILQMLKLIQQVEAVLMTIKHEENVVTALVETSTFHLNYCIRNNSISGTCTEIVDDGFYKCEKILFVLAR